MASPSWERRYSARRARRDTAEAEAAAGPWDTPVSDPPPRPLAGLLREGHRHLDGRLPALRLRRLAGVRRRQLRVPAAQGVHAPAAAPAAAEDGECLPAAGTTSPSSGLPSPCLRGCPLRHLGDPWARSPSACPETPEHFPAPWGCVGLRHAELPRGRRRRGGSRGSPLRQGREIATGPGGTGLCCPGTGRPGPGCTGTQSLPPSTHQFRRPPRAMLREGSRHPPGTALATPFGTRPPAPGAFSAPRLLPARASPRPGQSHGSPAVLFLFGAHQKGLSSGTASLESLQQLSSQHSGEHTYATLSQLSSSRVKHNPRAAPGQRSAPPRPPPPLTQRSPPRRALPAGGGARKEPGCDPCRAPGRRMELPVPGLKAGLRGRGCGRFCRLLGDTQLRASVSPAVKRGRRSPLGSGVNQAGVMERAGPGLLLGSLPAPRAG